MIRIKEKNIFLRKGLLSVLLLSSFLIAGWAKKVFMFQNM